MLIPTATFAVPLIALAMTASAFEENKTTNGIDLDVAQGDESSDVVQKKAVHRRVLVFIKGRNQTLTVHTGQRFSVSSNDGKTLAAEVSVVELRKRYPQIYEFYRSSYAEAWAGL